MVATLLVIASGSIYGVTRFSIATGGLNWFQHAWDEPFYLSDILDSSLHLNSRAASHFLGRMLMALGTQEPVWITLAYDLVFPIAVFAVAYLLSKHFATQVIARLAWTIALLFSFELLSFSSFLIFPNPPMVLLANAIGNNWLFAADPLPYFNLYRTPEPQVSWVIFFAYLYLLVRYCDRQEHRIYQIVCCLNPFLPLVYSNVGIVSLMLFATVSAGCILFFRRPIVLWFVGSLIATGLAFWFTFTTASAKMMMAQTVFSTHLPIIRLSIAYSLVGLLVFAVRIWRRNWAVTPRDLACACLFAVPLITLNQQIVTGRAVITQHWEYYINYICIMAGAGLLLTNPLNASTSRPSRLRGATVIACWLAFLVLIVRGQVENVRLFAPANVASLAQARAYDAAIAKVGTVTRVVTSHLFDDSLFMTRVPPTVRVLGSYNWLAWNSPPPMIEGETFGAHLARTSQDAKIGYEVLARRGFTPEALRSDLVQEISTGNCWPALVYFFAYIDCWSRMSNYRSRLVLDPNAAIASIVDGYREYLRRTAASLQSEPTLVLASQPKPTETVLPFRQTLVSQAKVEFIGISASAYFYLQTMP